MFVSLPRITAKLMTAVCELQNLSEMKLTMKWSSEMNNGRGLSPLTTFLFSISFHHFAVDKMNVCSSILIQTLIGRESFFLQDSAVRVPEGKMFPARVFTKWKGESFHDVLEQFFR